jgi:hypothetical protein
MAYSDFTFRQLLKKYGLHYKLQSLNLSSAANLIVPSEYLLKDLQEAKMMPIYSEKAKSELIITPVLKELRRHCDYDFTIFSGYGLDVGGELSGICDYIIAKIPNAIEVEAPIICMVESKNKSPEEGYAQCAAEMYAAKIFNEREGKTMPYIYGCVTNAFDWIFMRLEDDTFYIDQERYNLEDTSKLLGVMYYIVKQFKAY